MPPRYVAFTGRPGKSPNDRDAALRWRWSHRRRPPRARRTLFSGAAAHSFRPPLVALALALLGVCPGVAADDGAAIALGAREYASNCAVCHGIDARGDGPMHDKLVRRPSDLTLLSRNNGGSFPETVVYQIVDGRGMSPFHGTREMPIWGVRFRFEGDDEAQVDARVSRLIEYLESVQRD